MNKHQQLLERDNKEYLYSIGRGEACHKIMIEKGHALPGQVIAAPYSHATTYGACGAY